MNLRTNGQFPFWPKEDPSISIFTTKNRGFKRHDIAITRSEDIFVTPDSHCVCNAVDNPSEMALKTSHHKYNTYKFGIGRTHLLATKGIVNLILPEWKFDALVNIW